MVRKQIYIQRRQQALLKRLARARGVSQAELIREALDHQASANSWSAQPDPEAWERAHRFMLALHARGPLRGRARTWTRDELYEDRLSRYARRPD